MDEKVLEELSRRAKKEVLDDGYTFDTFEETESNKLARQMAIKVANNPGEEEYNPLIICGEKGVGKTHLMHAIGNYIADKNSDAKVGYVTTGTFVGEALVAIMKNNVRAFRKKYCDYDVLFVDDLQMFSGKTSGLSELAFVFDMMITHAKQIVFGCTVSRDKEKLRKIGEVIARFSSDDLGYVVDINQNNPAIAFKVPNNPTIFMNKLKEKKD